MQQTGAHLILPDRCLISLSCGSRTYWQVYWEEQWLLIVVEITTLIMLTVIFNGLF